MGRVACWDVFRHHLDVCVKMYEACMPDEPGVLGRQAHCMAHSGLGIPVPGHLTWL